MKTAGLVYAHAASNYGDVAINAGVKSLVDQLDHLELTRAVTLKVHDRFIEALQDSIGSDVAVTNVGSTVAGEPLEELVLLAHYLSHPDKFLSDANLEDVDVILLNSGEHLFESETARNATDLLWRILPAIAGAWAGKRIIQLPATIGPFRTESGSSLVKALLSTSSVATRESNSADYVKNQFGVSQIANLIDPAFFLHSPATAREKNADSAALVLRMEEFGLRAGAQRSSLTQARAKSTGYSSSKAFSAFYQIGKTLLDQGKKVVVVVQTTADRELSKALVSALAEIDEERVTLADPGSLTAFHEELARHGAVVASRFHACIIAMTSGVPAIGLYSPSHGPKMPGLFASLGAPDFAIIVGDRDPNSIASDVEKRLGELSDASSVMRTNVERLKDEAREWLSAQVSTPRPDGVSVDSHRIKLMACAVTEMQRVAKEAIDSDLVKRLRRIESGINKLTPA